MQYCYTQEEITPLCIHATNKLNSVIRRCGRLRHTSTVHDKAERKWSSGPDVGPWGQPSDGDSSRTDLENRRSLWQSVSRGGEWVFSYDSHKLCFMSLAAMYAPIEMCGTKEKCSELNSTLHWTSTQLPPLFSTGLPCWGRESDPGHATRSPSWPGNNSETHPRRQRTTRHSPG